MTDKEYLTNGQILLKHFKLVFFQLYAVKILCKFITIRLSYKRKKRGVFLWNTVYMCLLINSIGISDMLMTLRAAAKENITINY